MMGSRLAVWGGARGVALLVLLATTAAWGQAEPEAAAAEAVDSNFRAELTLSVFWLGVEGDISAGNLPARIEADGLEIIESSDSLSVIFGRLEFGYGRLGAFVDATYININLERQTKLLDLPGFDVMAELASVDVALMYRVADWPDDVGRRGGALDLYSGIRIFTLGADVQPPGAPESRIDADWVDPILGLKLRQPLLDGLHLDLWGDIGGFGLASSITWSATGILGYDFQVLGLLATIYGGYRAIGWDYSEGDGDDRFDWDIIFHGPTLGLQIRF